MDETGYAAGTICNYTDTGLFDGTHLRFFCYCTAKHSARIWIWKSRIFISHRNDFPLKNRLTKLFPRFSQNHRKDGLQEWLKTNLIFLVFISFLKSKKSL